jgi:hypothetical protein
MGVPEWLDEAPAAAVIMARARAGRLTGVLARSASFDARRARDLHGALLARLGMPASP